MKKIFPCLPALLAVVLSLGYWHKVRTPLRDHLNKVQKMAEDAPRYEKMRREMDQKEEKMRHEIIALQERLSVASAMKEGGKMVSSLSEAFLAVPVENFKIQGNRDRSKKNAARRRELERRIRSKERSKTAAARRESIALRKEMHRLEKESQPGITIQFVVSDQEIARVNELLRHLSSYGPFDRVRVEPGRTPGQIAFDLVYLATPFAFLSFYDPLSFPEKSSSVSSIPFRSPSPIEKRLTQGEANHLTLTRVFYDPRTPHRSLALIDGNLVSPGDEMGPIYVKEIAPDFVSLGYYGEISLFMKK